MKTKALTGLAAIAGALILTAIPFRPGNLMDGEVFRVNEACAAGIMQEEDEIMLPCFPAMNVCIILIGGRIPYAFFFWENVHLT